MFPLVFCYFFSLITMCGKGGPVPIEFVCCRELDDEVSADLGEDVRIHQSGNFKLLHKLQEC